MDVETCIRENIAWPKLPEDVRILLGNSSKEYEKRVFDYSIRNQLRYKGNLVRHVKKSEELYYDHLIRFSESHLMLFPYHLSDIIVRELRTSPFNYYINILSDMLNQEKSYDSLPNFTAADAVRLLGIGRNQYIDLMNQTRSNRKFLRRNRTTRELLPQKPAKLSFEPWWTVSIGSVLESDVKMLTEEERKVIDRLFDSGPQSAGTMPVNVITALYNRGLVYFEVPVEDNDYVFVAPLDGFVMNRVLGDYFETLLYKIFVAIDDQTTVKEMAQILHIDTQLVKNAISLFCRLGFARKRVTGAENLKLHFSWAGLVSTGTPTSGSAINSPTSPTQEDISTGVDLNEFSTNLTSLDDDESEEAQSPSSNDSAPMLRGFSPQPPTLTKEGSMTSSTSSSLPTSDVGTSNRAAFVFDSSLAAFLMMGNLSASLKGHAVTLFEVGKLADEQMRDFLEQLECVNQFAEGEAQRYSAHATALLDSLRSLRQGREADLLRGESLLTLDESSRVRVLAKSYGILVAMAPLLLEACTVPISSIPFIGPPNAETCSPWFRLAIYGATRSGPASIYLPQGTRLTTLPQALLGDENDNLATNGRILVSSPKHEPHLVAVQHALLALNDLLSNSAVFVQNYPPSTDESDLIVFVPFPFNEAELETEDSFCKHPAILILTERIGLRHLAGYVVLLKNKVVARDNVGGRDIAARMRVDEAFAELGGIAGGADAEPGSAKNSILEKLPEGSSFDDYVLLDCVFGVPLFNAQLNKTICEKMSSCGILNPENRINIQFANKEVVTMVNDVISKSNFGLVSASSLFPGSEQKKVEIVPPIRPVHFDADSREIEYVDKAPASRAVNGSFRSFLRAHATRERHTSANELSISQDFPSSV
ncbi:unnamed protein product [Caenorhabditis auriculariae]|uniref:Protein FAM91A1 n=1 Tax=Caenorhabditis auriculariae TaxID=2777116 RepID=A0A8S1HE63_9PELO|nr:unnamed protein product [Caenorhabditis auriculariae]